MMRIDAAFRKIAEFVFFFAGQEKGDDHEEHGNAPDRDLVFGKVPGNGLSDPHLSFTP